MVLEQEDEALADRAGGAKDTWIAESMSAKLFLSPVMAGASSKAQVRTDRTFSLDTGSP